jgi:hypothetical protein
VSLTLISPWGALVALAVVVPLAALARGEARAAAVARSLGLPGGSRRWAPLAALGALAVLLGATAAQPVVVLETERQVRTDAEVYFVLDTTLSMLAAPADGRARLERAKEAARRIRADLDDVPAGLASFTDRVLPHLFPTGDHEVFADVLDRVVRIEHPPPEGTWTARATTFAALDALPTRNFYSPSAIARAVVVLTDGETQDYELHTLAATLQRPPGITPVLVHVRGTDERLVVDGKVDRAYESDPLSGRTLKELATAAGGAAVEEGDAEAAVAAVRRALGSGEHVAEGRRRRTIPLAPWLVAVAALPALVVVARRNL